ncbi:hypothetical protein [Nitrincola sp. MINF-07-Sa-05]|uniref:hypothetical protein n=1 Tax=Nitrincola salilacus TaxID=3400273 RepID=UPI0039180510
MSSRLKLVLLILVLGAPMPVAWAMLHWQIGLPDKHIARGELSHQLPPLTQWPIEWVETDDWWLVWAASEVCNESCKAEADKWWRMHRALGRNAERVYRLRLGGDMEALPGELQVSWLSNRPDWVADGQVWLVDPQGNVVTRYEPYVDAKDVHKDLEHLLKRNPER